MAQLSNAIYKRKTAVVERIIQFGTGNFLRAFVDWLVDDVNKTQQNDLGIVIVQSTNGKSGETINKQNGLYTLVTRGLKNGNEVDEVEVIESVTRSIRLSHDFEQYLTLATSQEIEIIVSNTTEAGIYFEDIPFKETPAPNFSANLTHFLWKRYEAFGGDSSKGLLILPCELIEANGDVLKDCIIRYAKAWSLPNEFIEWIESANTFCNTLVDRIVPGYPKDEIAELTKRIGYEDELIVTAEPYYIWVIEGNEYLRELLPFQKSRHEVLFVDNLNLYRERKVKVLNGAHTTLTPISLLLNIETVSEALHQEVIGRFVEQFIEKEVLPTIDADKTMLLQYKNEIIERFKNPFIKHYVKSIALNAIAKYKTRNVPALLSYVKEKGEIPKRNVTSLAAWIYLYKNEAIFSPTDDAEVIKFIRHNSVYSILQNEELWGVNLAQIEGIQSFIEEAMMSFSKCKTREWIASLEVNL